MDIDKYNSLNRLLKANVSRSFGNAFKDKVMKEIRELGNVLSDYDILVESLANQFKKFAYTGLLIIILMVSYNIITGGEVSLARALDLPEYSVEEALDPVNTYWSNK